MNKRIPLLNWHGFEEVQRIALRHALDDNDEHYIGEFLGGNPVGSGRTYVSRSDNRYFLVDEDPFKVIAKSLPRGARGHAGINCPISLPSLLLHPWSRL